MEWNCGDSVLGQSKGGNHHHLHGAGLPANRTRSCRRRSPTGLRSDGSEVKREGTVSSQTLPISVDLERSSEKNKKSISPRSKRACLIVESSIQVITLWKIRAQSHGSSPSEQKRERYLRKSLATQNQRPEASCKFGIMFHLTNAAPPKQSSLQVPHHSRTIFRNDSYSPAALKFSCS